MATSRSVEPNWRCRISLLYIGSQSPDDRYAGIARALGLRRRAALGGLRFYLPVYDSWFFTTTEGEDLETVARRLRGYDLSATSRPKMLDVSTVSGNVVGKLAPFEGAFRPVGTPVGWTGPAVAAAAKLLGSELEHTPVGGVSVVGPPVYGSIASGQSKPVPGWLSDLDRTPDGAPPRD